MYIKRKAHDRGSILFTLMVAILMFVLISSVVGYLANQNNFSYRRADHLKAYYLADGAASLAMNDLQKACDAWVKSGDYESFGPPDYSGIFDYLSSYNNTGSSVYDRILTIDSNQVSATIKHLGSEQFVIHTSAVVKDVTCNQLTKVEFSDHGGVALLNLAVEYDVTNYLDIINSGLSTEQEKNQARQDLNNKLQGSSIRLQPITSDTDQGLMDTWNLAAGEVFIEGAVYSQGGLQGVEGEHVLANRDNLSQSGSSPSIAYLNNDYTSNPHYSDPSYMNDGYLDLSMIKEDEKRMFDYDKISESSTMHFSYDEFVQKLAEGSDADPLEGIIVVDVGDYDDSGPSNRVLSEKININNGSLVFKFGENWDDDMHKKFLIANRINMTRDIDDSDVPDSDSYAWQNLPSLMFMGGNGYIAHHADIQGIVYSTGHMTLQPSADTKQTYDGGIIAGSGITVKAFKPGALEHGKKLTIKGDAAALRRLKLDMITDDHNNPDGAYVHNTALNKALDFQPVRIRIIEKKLGNI